MMIIEILTSFYSAISSWVYLFFSNFVAFNFLFYYNNFKFLVQVFSKLVSTECSEFIRLHLYPLIEVAVRIQLTTTGPDAGVLQTLKETSFELLDSLQKKVGSSHFLECYSEVQKQVQSRRAERKRKFAAEAVLDPKAFASNRVSNVIIIDQIWWWFVSNFGTGLSITLGTRPGWESDCLPQTMFEFWYDRTN